MIVSYAIWNMMPWSGIYGQIEPDRDRPILRISGQDPDGLMIQINILLSQIIYQYENMVHILILAISIWVFVRLQYQYYWLQYIARAISILIFQQICISGTNNFKNPVGPRRPGSGPIKQIDIKLLKLFRPKPFYFLNHCRKESDPTKNDSDSESLNLNNAIFNRFWVDSEIQYQSRSMSDPPFSDIDFKNKMAWLSLKTYFGEWFCEFIFFKHWFWSS